MVSLPRPRYPEIMSTKHILLGIGGGIAAYKSPLIVRELVNRGHEVIPVLTAAAHEFVTSTTLAAVSGQRVRSSLWDEEAERAMSHIELARWADVLLIAPSTADLMASMAHGHAPDLLTTVYLATEAPTVIAPAMNQQMWLHKATQQNLKRLKDNGVMVLGPDSGSQACGEEGPGRMLEPSDIVDTIATILEGAELDIHQGTLSGINVLITAGPTREAIDPVRYITNASSGRQGFAIARAAEEAGANVTLISGPVNLETPAGVTRIDVVTASEMKKVVMAQVDKCDICIAVAAVADYRPKNRHDLKIKKRHVGSDELTLELIENDDIVHSVAVSPNRPYLVGFAAETHNVEQYAREKRARKDMDVIILNDVSNTEIGFDSLDNAVTLISKDNKMSLPRADKQTIARQVVATISNLYAEHVGHAVSESVGSD